MQHDQAPADSSGQYYPKSDGIFAEWQPRYAGHGIPTFPVRIIGKDKKPAVSNYLKMSLGTSAKLVKRFGNCEALGFAVRQAGITVIDIDNSDERTWGDLLDRHGHTPVLVRTGSGNLQAWYRHNGEPRLPRLWPDCPADLLGAGYVTAPPSRAAKCDYRFIQGGLDDIDRLPVMRVLRKHARF
jgi:hypothetical protein